MARTKTSFTKRELEQIDAVLISHEEKIASVAFDAESDLPVVVTFPEALNLDPVAYSDVDEALAEALELAAAALEEQGTEETLDDDAEGEAVKSIVPRKYRDEYKARGDARSCGDWLAHALRDLLNGGSKKNPVDLTKLYSLAAANGCYKTWDNLNPGQQRMNAGNAIRRTVATQGFLYVPADVSPTGEERKIGPDYTA